MPHQVGPHQGGPQQRGPHRRRPDQRPALSGRRFDTCRRVSIFLAAAALQGLLAAGLGIPITALAAASVTDKVTGGQKDAALEFLAAVASGDPQQVAMAIHPDDLLALRMRILTLLRDEAKQEDSTIRARLFGQAMPLAEIERLTNTGFFAVLSDRLSEPGGREYSDAEGIAAVAEKNGNVEVVIRAKQPRERGKVQVVNVVTVKPYGKDWKAAIPSEIQAQIDDLIAGRTAGSRFTAVAARGAGPRPGSGTSPVQPALAEVLSQAEKELSDGKCDEYYSKRMSPNFRRVTSRKAMEALVSSCQNSLGTRTMLLSTLHIVRGMEPHYEYEGQRAVFDLKGQGLPFDEFVLEQVDKRWYVAE
jgi:hypothetical protein